MVRKGSGRMKNTYIEHRHFDTGSLSGELRKKSSEMDRRQKSCNVVKIVALKLGDGVLMVDVWYGYVRCSGYGRVDGGGDLG